MGSLLGAAAFIILIITSIIVLISKT